MEVVAPLACPVSAAGVEEDEGVDALLPASPSWIGTEVPPRVDVDGDSLRVTGSLRTVGSTRVTGGGLLRVGAGVVVGARTTSAGTDGSGARVAVPGAR